MPGHSVSMSGAPRRFRFSVRAVDPFDLAFALLIVALFVLVGATFREYAVSNDEGLQHHYGELIVAYYKSGLADKSVFDYGNLYLYGGLFDIIAVLLAHVLPFDPYDIRHLMCAVAGTGGVAATWATARMIAGPRAGLLAGLALALCGVWYGSMFNHTKDVPFASAMMGATFFLLRAARSLPDPRRRDILWFGILLGAALGLRATGLLMVCYAVALIGLQSWSLRQHDWRRFARVSARSLLHFVPAFAVAYVIMIASWPWASLAFLNPARAIFAFAHFHYPIRGMRRRIRRRFGHCSSITFPRRRGLISEGIAPDASCGKRRSARDFFHRSSLVRRRNLVTRQSRSAREIRDSCRGVDARKSCIAAGEIGRWPAPKEQPPRKLSGT